MLTTPDVTIITDGSALRNPGPGGWAAILIARNGHTAEVSGGESHTTNNRMEITALLEGLKRLNRPCRILVIADSKYVINSVSKWMNGWHRRGWKKSDDTPVMNADLWKQIHTILNEEGHNITFKWVKGHNGHDLNERADDLAREQAEKQKALLKMTSKETEDE